VVSTLRTATPEAAASGPYDAAALKRDRPLVGVLEAGGVRLRPGTAGTFWALCPFHAETQASFFVDVRDPDDQHFHCFGACGAHGDVITFVRLRERVGFAEACARLAGAAPPGRPPAPPGAADSRVRSPGAARRARRWDRLSLDEQVVLSTACAVYQHALWRAPAVLAYLRGRGLPDWVIRQCGLGYADGHSLEAYLRRRSGLLMAQELGLLRAPSRGDGARPLREFFAGRVVVPELRGGHAIWFIGRRLADDGARAKYVALPGERPVLGYDRAAGRREVFLCEGVFDYLTAVAWRLPACSPCGTALPAERLGFLAGTRAVYGVLDGDDAGRAAAERFGTQLGGRFLPVRLPDGCDLNDLGRGPQGRAQFFRLLTAARLSGRPAPPARAVGDGELTEEGGDGGPPDPPDRPGGPVGGAGARAVQAAGATRGARVGEVGKRGH
jgi:DNA primase catalytic core